MAGLPGPGSSSSIDLVEERAVPYAERVLGRLLTLPEAHWPELGALAMAVSANLDPMIRGERAVAARESAERLNEFLRDHLRRRRAGGSGTDLAGLPMDSGKRRPAGAAGQDNDDDQRRDATVSVRPIVVSWPINAKSRQWQSGDDEDRNNADQRGRQPPAHLTEETAPADDDGDHHHPAGQRDEGV